jgi:hypothetical protein
MGSCLHLILTYLLLTLTITFASLTHLMPIHLFLTIYTYELIVVLGHQSVIHQSLVIIAIVTLVYLLLFFSLPPSVCAY